MSQTRFCSSCGRQNTSIARFCMACGQPMFVPGSPQVQPQPTASRGTTGLRTATMVLGLVTATLLFMGGCSGFFFGATFGAFEEAFDIEEDRNKTTSTTADVENAGGFAIVVSLVLFLGAGLARVAVKISILLLAAVIPMAVGLALTDWSSLFAITYYFAILATSVCVILMCIAYWRRRRA